MKRFLSGIAFWAFLWGCGRTPFLISDFDSDYRPKVKTVALLPFELPPGNVLAEEHRPLLEETVTRSIAGGDFRHAYVSPSRARMRLKLSNLEGSSLSGISANRLGELFSAEVLLFSDVIRLHQSAGDNPTTREIGAAKFQRRGVELMMEFRLVEAATGKLLWKYRVRRFGEDVEAAGRLVGQAAAEAWPFRS